MKVILLKATSYHDPATDKICRGVKPGTEVDVDEETGGRWILRKIASAVDEKAGEKAAAVWKEASEKKKKSKA